LRSCGSGAGVPKIQLPNNWQPRSYQNDVWSYLEDGGKHAELVWHRRSGKDEVGLHWTAVAAFQRVGTYWYMLPLASQAKKAIWNAVNPHTGKKRIDEAFPEEIRKRKNDQEMYIEFQSGSTWQVVGSDNFNSLVGSPPIGLVYSEWALSNPAAKAYLRPILAENNGWQIFNTTPRGKNHAHRTLQAAKDDPEAFAQVLTAHQTGILSQQQLDRLLADYINDYGEALGTAYFEQEFLCSFETPIMGAVYAKELREAADRIRPVPHDPSKPVHLFWDLGRADKTAIWFAQLGPYEFRVIDYMEGVGKHIGEYIVDLQHKRYAYGDCWLPHDANNELLAAERTVAQQLRSAGFKTRTVTKTSVDTRIEAARLMLPMTYFDENKCELGLDALRNYRYRVDEDTKQFSSEPLHDWASHASDAFGYMAIALKEDKPKKEYQTTPPRRQFNTGRNLGGTWM
jgi:phage terminase large subunit